MCSYRALALEYWGAQNADMPIPSSTIELSRLAREARNFDPVAFPWNGAGDASEFYQFVTDEMFYLEPGNLSAAQLEQWRMEHEREVQWNEEYKALFQLDYQEEWTCQACDNLEVIVKSTTQLDVAAPARPQDRWHFLDSWFQGFHWRHCGVCAVRRTHRMQRRIVAAPQVLRVAISVVEKNGQDWSKLLEEWQVPEKMELQRRQMNMQLPLDYKLSTSIAHGGLDNFPELDLEGWYQFRLTKRKEEGSIAPSDENFEDGSDVESSDDATQLDSEEYPSTEGISPPNSPSFFDESPQREPISPPLYLKDSLLSSPSTLSLPSSPPRFPSSSPISFQSSPPLFPLEDEEEESSELPLIVPAYHVYTSSTSGASETDTTSLASETEEDTESLTSDQVQIYTEMAASSSTHRQTSQASSANSIISSETYNSLIATDPDPASAPAQDAPIQYDPLSSSSSPSPEPPRSPSPPPSQTLFRLYDGTYDFPPPTSQRTILRPTFSPSPPLHHPFFNHSLEDSHHIVNVQGPSQCSHISDAHYEQIAREKLGENPQRPGDWCARPRGYQVVHVTYVREKLKGGFAAVERDLCPVWEG